MADTITLKNGRSIDGTVTGRHEGYVILRIGNIGTMRIPQLEIERVERNTRTGYLDPNKGKKTTAKKVPKVPSRSATERDSTDTVESKSGESAGSEKLDPELEKEIGNLVQDLTKQRTQKRTRAERRLEKIGEAAVPQLVEISSHPFDRTRAAVFRLLKRSKDFRIVEPCLAGMKDKDRFVRKLAWEGLKSVSGESFPFPWDGHESRRARSLKLWESWAFAEKKRQEAAAKKAESEKENAPEPSQKKESSESGDSAGS